MKDPRSNYPIEYFNERGKVIVHEAPIPLQTAIQKFLTQYHLSALLFLLKGIIEEEIHAYLDHTYRLSSIPENKQGFRKAPKQEFDDYLKEINAVNCPGWVIVMSEGGITLH